MPPRTQDSLVIDSLYRISQVVNTTDDPEEALERIIDEIMLVLPTEFAAIELINPDTLCLEIEVFRGFRQNPLGTRLQIGEGITGWVALHGNTVYVPDVRLDYRYVEIDPTIRSEMATPMKGEDGQIFGVVNIDSSSIDAFSEQDRKILELLATEATRVVNRIWLIRQLRAKADHLETLIHIGKAIVTKRDLPDILNALTQACLQIIDGKICALFFLSEDGTELELKACHDRNNPRYLEERVSLEDSSIGTAIRRQKLIEVSNLPKTEEHHFLQLISEEKLVSMLCCPIRFEDEMIGVLNVYTDYPHRFNNEERQLFEGLASLGAAAIQNARLYERIFQSEESLRKTERLTTLGLLSAEIAHEIRNPLTVIRLLLESLDLKFGENDLRNQDTRIIHEKLDQLEEIVSRVLSFSKSRQDLKSRYNLNTLIEDTLILIRLKLQQQKIQLHFDPSSSPIEVEVHKGQLQQALLNLMLNATQAISTNGSISLSAKRESIDSQEFAVVRIRDTGDGIPTAIRDQIFDSFLSSKTEGTGLGLSIVKRILKSHGGDVSVERSSSQGTTMRLVLPLLRKG